MTSWFDNLADSILDGGVITEEQAVAILATPDADLLALVAAGSRLRRTHFGMTIKLNYLVNLKSGLCPESCSYCSQALGSAAPILKYSWLKTEEAVKQADFGIRGGASRVCLVASGRGPGNRDVERVNDIVTRLKDDHHDLEVCACLGILKDGQAESLEEAGVDAYNHNINTAESFHDTIVKSHTYADRTNTVAKAKTAGLSPCSGLIVGIGESDEQVVEALFALRELDSDSIPINFLVPFDGTPMEGQWNLTPAQCLRIVVTARFVCPDKEIRLAGPPAVAAGPGTARGELHLPRRLPHSGGAGCRGRHCSHPRQRVHHHRPGERSQRHTNSHDQGTGRGHRAGCQRMTATLPPVRGRNLL